jgi:hypothetical protein
LPDLRTTELAQFGQARHHFNFKKREEVTRDMTFSGPVAQMDRAAVS